MTSREKKRCTGVLNIEFISKQSSQFFVFAFLSLQFKFSIHPCILCCLIATPPHPFAYFLYTSDYLLQTPDNSNFFQFYPEGSSYRSTVSRSSSQLTLRSKTTAPVGETEDIDKLDLAKVLLLSLSPL